MIDETDKPLEGEVIPKKKVGRPSKFDPAKTEELVTLMAEGLTDVRICAKWGISRNTFYRWLRENEEFKKAYDDGYNRAEAWWEELGIAGMMGQIPKFNPTLYLATMNNKFKWSRNPNGEGGTKNTQINIENMSVLQNKSAEELEAQAKALLKLPGMDALLKEESDEQGSD